MWAIVKGEGNAAVHLSVRLRLYCLIPSIFQSPFPLLCRYMDMAGGKSRCPYHCSEQEYICRTQEGKQPYLIFQFHRPSPFRSYYTLTQYMSLRDLKMQVPSPKNGKHFPGTKKKRQEISALLSCRFTIKVPPPDRRHVFRYAKCVHQTFAVRWRIHPLDACRFAANVRCWAHVGFGYHLIHPPMGMITAPGPSSVPSDAPPAPLPSGCSF